MMTDAQVVGLLRIAGGSLHRPGPVTDEEAEVILHFAQFEPEPTPEEVNRWTDQLLMRRLHDDGEWIPSSECSPAEIAHAQAACDRRWYVNEHGFGWLWRP